MSFFYSKFALNNLVKNKKFIIPYVLSAIFTIMSFYILSSLAFGDNLDKLPNGIDATKQVLSFGIIVIALFSVIFLFYTYSFLIKRRVKEFGLYSVLGMTKKQIAKILVLETIFIAITTLVLGIGLGIIFDKLMLLVLLKLFSAGVSFGFSITPIAIVFSVLLFGGIYFLLLLYTVIKIARLRIVALLKDENKGEKEPKSRWILAIIGLALIGYGYYTAQTVQNPVKALLVFFYAVVAVIIGTYLVFMAVSITVLKIMKNNKNFYYKPKNFISVSGLLYRMKRNAVGLANICILSTMVLVTMGSTSALYAGMEKSYNERFPRQLMIAGYHSTSDKLKEIENNAKTAAKEAGTEAEDMVSYNSLPMVGRLVEDKFNFESNVGVDLSNVKMIVVLQLKDYNKFANKNKTLESNEIFLHIDKKGNYVIKPQYKFATSFSEGLAFVDSEGDSIVCIDKKGKTKFYLKEAIPSPFREGLARFWDIAADNFKNNIGYIDTAGKIVISPRFILSDDFSEGLAAFLQEDSTMIMIQGFIDKTGKVVIEPQFDEAGSFSEGLAVIRLGEYYGYINKTGKIVINPQFDEAGDFHNGMAVIEQEGYYGYIDKTGKIKIRPQFEKALPFSSNIAFVRSEYKWGVIDKKGKYLVNPQFDRMKSPYKGRIEDWMDDYSSSVIDSKAVDTVAVED